MTPSHIPMLESLVEIFGGKVYMRPTENPFWGSITTGVGSSLSVTPIPRGAVAVNKHQFFVVWVWKSSELNRPPIWHKVYETDDWMDVLAKVSALIAHYKEDQTG